MALFLALVGLTFIKAILSELGHMSQMDSSIIEVMIGVPVLLVLDFSGLINIGNEERG